jgi:protein arginine kinase activator
MLCENCKKRTATVFYNEKLNGKSRSLSLCGECASKLREKGEIQDVTSMIESFADPFWATQDTLFNDFFGISSLPKKAEHSACSFCGSTLTDILQNGKVGCPECYSTFRDALTPLMRSLHGASLHRGSVPQRQLAVRARNEQLGKLRKELQKALSEEDYESAASLRDEIRTLENGKEMNQNGLV